MGTENKKPSEDEKEKALKTDKNAEVPLENCVKPQNAESSRLEDTDDACDDGVK